MSKPDWSKFEDAEIKPALRHGAWTLRGTRITPDEVLRQAVDQTPEEIARDVYPNLTPERIRRMIAFAKGTHALHLVR